MNESRDCFKDSNGCLTGFCQGYSGNSEIDRHDAANRKECLFRRWQNQRLCSPRSNICPCRLDPKFYSAELPISQTSLIRFGETSMSFIEFATLELADVEFVAVGL